MTCPHCQTDDTQKLDRATDLGYCRFRCRRCGCRFNERTGTPFNYLEFPTDIVFQVIVSRLLFKLSLRDLVRMFLMRGYEFTHETVREWEERFAPLLAEHLRRKRKGKMSRRWYVDETYVKVKGKWCYLYRAIDREGNLVDSMLSATRDMAAARRFFRSTLSVVDRPPQQVTSDGHDSYPRAIREVLGHNVEHRCSAFLNRRIEQDHRGVKQRYYPMLGFGAFDSAQRFCRAFEEMRQYFRPRRKQNEVISLANGRRKFLFRVIALESMFLAA
jgi:putative transposase